MTINGDFLWLRMVNFMGWYGIYPLVMSTVSYWSHGHWNSGWLPIWWVWHGDFPVRYVNIYQRVDHLEWVSPVYARSELLYTVSSILYTISSILYAIRSCSTIFWVWKPMAGWWLTYPSEKYSSAGILIPKIWKQSSKCSSHQPDGDYAFGLLPF